MRVLLIALLTLSQWGCGRKAPLEPPSGYEDRPPIEIPDEDRDEPR